MHLVDIFVLLGVDCSSTVHTKRIVAFPWHCIHIAYFVHNISIIVVVIIILIHCLILYITLVLLLS